MKTINNITRSRFVLMTCVTPLRWGRPLCRLVSICAVGLLVTACDLPGTVVRAADGPGTLREARFTVDGKVATLRFRYCPAGLLVAGNPEKEPRTTVPMTSFYIGETEISFRNFGELLGQDKQEEVLKAATSISTEHLTTNPELPAFAVTMEDVIILCRRLNELSDANSANDMADIETRRFRLPTHHEWQYACRAETTENIKFPHFHEWPAGINPHETMDKNVRAKSLEIWKDKLGMNPGDFRGSQAQISQICTYCSDVADAKIPLEVLTSYLRSGLGIQRDFSEDTPPDPLVLVVPGSGRKNQWGIMDMFGNVCEWTLFAPESQAATESWNAIVNVNDLSNSQKERTELFIAGGSFHKTMAPDIIKGVPRWSSFAIWGGAEQEIDGTVINFDHVKGKITPFNMLDLDHDEWDPVFDELPGLRLVVVPSLHNKWLTIVRKDVAGEIQQSKDLHSKFDFRKEKIANLVPDKQLASIVAKLEHYRALAVYRTGQLDEAKQLVSKLDYGSPLKGEGLYFKLVQQAIIGDQKSADAPPEP